MNKNALDRLRQLVAQKKLESLVEQVAGPEAETLDKRAGSEVTKLAAEIKTASGGAKNSVQFSQLPEFSSHVTYNEAQDRAIQIAFRGQPLALTGPAGSGKTTTVKGIIKKLLQDGNIPIMESVGHNHLVSGLPGIVCTSFTNKAVENMKKVLPRDLRYNCVTIHKLLEYQPEYFEVYDEEKGIFKNTMQFIPTRHADNKLPASIKVLVIDEATMLGVDLWNKLADALHDDVQIILVGDIQQLPPVFGKSIFIHAMQHGVPKVELTEVHRQALESPIIALAHKILDGKQVPVGKLDELNYEGEHGKLLIKPWKKKLSDTAAMVQIGKFLGTLIDEEQYDPMEDVILCPFNKSFGTIELNQKVATHLVSKIRAEIKEGKRAGSAAEEGKVHEVIAGINKKYFRVGDKVLHNKTEYKITGIEINQKYFGKMGRVASLTMGYDGIESDPLGSLEAGTALGGKTEEDIDFLLQSLTFSDLNEVEDKISRAASHIITVKSDQLDMEFKLETTGEIGALDLGYAITVHKSQGSEYRRVLFITHESNSNMFFRELIYTGVTRAKEELIIICPPNFLVQGINSQRLPGKTLEEKIDAFERTYKKNMSGEDEIPQKLSLFIPEEERFLPEAREA